MLYCDANWKSGIHTDIEVIVGVCMSTRKYWTHILMRTYKHHWI